MRLNHNPAAVSAYRALWNASNGLSTHTERLSSGLRINRAADDAAGLAIAEGLRSQVGGLAQGTRNAGDGISLLRTAEGQLNETHAILQRMRDLAVQAANTAVMNEDTLGMIQTEIDQLTDEIDRIAYSAEFGGERLLDGTFRDKKLQVGANVGDTKTVNIYSHLVPAQPPEAAGIALWDVYQPDRLANIADPVRFTRTTAADGAVTVDVPVPAPKPASVRELADLLNTDPNFSATYTATIGYHEFADGTRVDEANLIVMAKEPGHGPVTSSGIGAATINSRPGRDETEERYGGYAAKDILGTIDVTRLPGTGTQTVTTGGSGGLGFGAGSEVVTAGTTTEVPTSWGASAVDAIGRIDRAIAIVSEGRAEMGALHNALEHTVSYNGVAHESMSAAESRLRDADMAQELTALKKREVTMQASWEMLSRANALPQDLLKLLG